MRTLTSYDLKQMLGQKIGKSLYTDCLKFIPSPDSKKIMDKGYLTRFVNSFRVDEILDMIDERRIVKPTRHKSHWRENILDVEYTLKSCL